MKPNVLFFVVSVLVLSLFLFAFFLKPPHPKTSPKYTPLGDGSCTLTCNKNGNLDPVNDPDYNVKEVIKNTLLIEQHLAEDQKYCKECIVKHFLISIAYLEEAIWMACKNCDKYPNLKESLTFYNQLFETWRKQMDDQQTRLNTLQELRTWRQQMIRLYYFDHA